MPQIINISTQYRNQFKNGLAYTDNPADYTDNYTGVIMEGTQCLIDVEIEWFANADVVDAWNVDGTNDIITRTIGDFREDGFNVGQKFRFISGWAADNTTPNEFEATIDFIRQDGLRIDFTVTAGAVTSTGAQSDVGIRALGNATENNLTGLVYKFGFVENGAAASFTSLVTGNNMAYQFGAIPRVTGVNAMNPVGSLLDWVTGNSSVEFISESDYYQNFQILHEFVVNPWFREGELTDLQDNIPPNEFEGTNSLKHVFDLDFRQVLSNPNTSIQEQFTDSLGSVGWFDENYNGLGDDYNIVSIAYEDTTSTDAVDSLQAALRTTVTIEIEKVSGAIVAGQKAGLFVSLLADQTQYQNKTTTLTDNFLYDALYHVEGTGTTAGAGVIKSFTSSISSGNIILVCELEYSALQQATLATITQPYYVLGVNIATIALSNDVSDRLTLKADVQPYILGADVSGLIAFDQLDFHFGDSTIGVDVGYTDFTGWIEDSLALEFNFTLETDPLKDAVLNDISFALIAFEDATGESFDLDSTIIDLSNVITSGGIQQIEIDNNRAYLFDDGNQYKEISITTGAIVGTLQNYSGVFAQKIRWEDWIKNLSVDTVFFNASDPNSGLNFKSSNYSGLNGYTIRLAVRANLQGLDDLGLSRSTDYEIVSPALSISDYNVGNGYTCVVETFRASNASALGGSVLVGDDTLIRATFTADAGAVTSLVDFWAAIKIQVDNQEGQQIPELSTDYLDSSGLLKPKDGFSFLDMAIVSGDVVCECVVDGSKAQNVNYNISGRIKEGVDTCFVEFMDGDCTEFMDGDLGKFMDQ